MSAGRFPWFRRLVHGPFKKRTMGVKSDKEVPNNDPAIVSERDKSTSAEKGIAVSKDNVGESQDNRALVPTTMKYITASGKQILTILKSAAGVIPVPMLQDAIGVSLKIIELCEEASAVEEKVKELQDRVGHLMIVILAHVTDKNEEGDKEVVAKAAKGIEEDIRDLLSILGTINKDLSEIKAQNRWMLTFYKDLNMNTLDDCIDRLAAALEKFKLANDLRDSDLLQNLHTRLVTMTNKVDGISKDMKHVVNTVDNIQHDLDNTRQAFDQVLARVKRSATLLSSDTVVRQQMPLKPEIFYGRDSLVEEISLSLMEEKTSRICILGPGGMGKTSVSLAVVESPAVQERFLRGKCVWVPCTGATSAALFLEILYAQLQVPGDKQATLEKIISELSSSNDPRLILFDNFETPWNASSRAQKEVEDILRQLAQLNHVAILITMRGKYPPCDNSINWQPKNIQPTDEESCLRMFHEINPSSKDDPNVCRLLHALGYMPFAVTLMASLGKEGQSTAEDLLEEWYRSGPDIISDDPEKNMNRSISLSVESPLVKENKNAVLLLHILSLLPAGTTKENLRWWAPTVTISSAIAALSKAALLLEHKQQHSDSPILFVVPVVQSYMQQHGRIADETREQIHVSCCQYVLDHACRFDEPEFHEHSKALASEDSNMQSILFDSSITQEAHTSERTLEALIAFCWYRCDTKPSPDLAKQALSAAEAYGAERHKALAEWCLGRTFHHASDLSCALEHLQIAYELFSSRGDLQWQRLGCKCGIDLVDTAQFEYEDKMDAVRLVRDVEAKCAPLSDDLIHGRCLLYNAFVLEKAEQLQEAMSYLDRAKVVLEIAGNAVDIAEVYQTIGRVHLKERRIPEALGALEEAWKHAEGSKIPYIQAEVSVELCTVLFSVDRDADAWKCIEIALAMASYVGSRIQIGQALELMGYGYLRRGDYQDAYNAYNAAAKACRRVDSWGHARCDANMSRIERKQRNPGELIGFERPDLDPDRALFYPSVQPSATGDTPMSSS